MKKYKLSIMFLSSMLIILAIWFSIKEVGQDASYKPKSVPKRIVLVGHIYNNPYWQMVKKGAEEAAKKRGCTLEYMGSKDGSIKDGVKQLDMAIASKADGIITYVQEEEQYTPYINKGIGKDIPIITVDTDAKLSNRLAFIGSDNVAAGETAAKELIKVAGNKGAIAIISGSSNATNQKERVLGFKDYIEENSKLRIDSIEISSFSPLQAELVAKKILKEKPYVNYLYCTSAFDGAGAAKAVNELNLSGKVKIICFDELLETIKYIKDGVIQATIIQKPYDMGYQSLNIIMDKIEGKSIQTNYDITFKVINKDNVDKYNGK